MGLILLSLLLVAVLELALEEVGDVHASGQKLDNIVF